jgi:hypothetical protein
MEKDGFTSIMWMIGDCIDHINCVADCVPNEHKTHITIARQRLELISAMVRDAQNLRHAYHEYHEEVNH